MRVRQRPVITKGAAPAGSAMGTVGPHVCFADELQQAQPNNNNHSDSDTKKWLLELEPSANGSSFGGHSPCSSLSLSISPTPRYERNMGFFQQLSRRFGLRSHDDLVHGDDASGTGGAAQEEDANSSSTDSYSSAMTAAAATGRATAQAAARLELMSCASSETSSTIDIDEQEQQQREREQHGKRKSSTTSSQHRTRFSRLHRRSTSSLRRAFESLSLTSRSLSCSGPSPPPPQQMQTARGAAAAAGGAGGAALPLKSALKSASTVELHHRPHRAASKSTSSSSACSNSSSCTNSSSTTTGSGTKGKQKPPVQRILRQPVSYTYLKGMSGLPTQRVPRSSVCCQYARR